MTKETVIKELTKKGYNVTEITISKNNADIPGIVFWEGSNFSTVIYIDAFLAQAEKCGDTLEKIIEEILKLYKEDPQNTIEPQLDKNFICNHIRIALQRNTEEDIVKKEVYLEGIESYLLLMTDSYSIKMTDEILKSSGMSIETAWACAEKNTFAAMEVIHMDGFSPCLFSAVDMLIFTTTYKYKGAASILNKEKLKEFGKILDTDKLVLFPSSIHEFIIMSYHSNYVEQNLSEMVRSINAAQVAPEEQLADWAYLYDLKTDIVKIL